MKILNIGMGAPFTENYSYQDNLLSEYQCKLGHDVTVLTTTLTRGEGGKIINVSPGAKTLDNGVKLIRVGHPGKLRSFLGLYPGIKKALDEVRPDFVFIHGLASFVPAAVIKYKKKNKNVAVVADNHQDEGTTYTKKFPFNIQLGIYKLFWKRWIKHVSMVYGTTSWRRAFAHRFYGIPEDKLDTLIMGIDSDRQPADTASVRRAVREELGVSDDEFLFVTGGKLDHFKKTTEIIKAFSACSDKKAKLLVFGSVLDEIKTEFDTLVSEDDRINYIGYVPSAMINRYFYASDFGLFAGRHSVLWEEAIGCGLPCLFRKYEEKDHTDVCGNCIRLKDASEDEIKQVISLVLSDKEKYAELKKNSEKAAVTFSYRTIAEKSIEFAKGL